MSEDLEIDNFDSFCMSSYLALRWVAEPQRSWCPGWQPAFPGACEQEALTVPDEPARIHEALAELTAQAVAGKRAALLLSAGIDSAILAALLGEGTRSYTIRFIAEGAGDESVRAAEFARAKGLEHSVIDVTWDDYLALMPDLMRYKKAPLHPVEIGLYKAGLVARDDGFEALVVGNGADSTFGGLDKLLSRDWSFDAFVERYTFLDPKRALRHPVDTRHIYEPYRLGEAGIDVQGFLKVVHGLGIIQAFENGIGAAGLATVAPYEGMKLGVPLDLARIRAGESKYLLRRVFRDLFPDHDVPEKIPFARPMSQWMADWSGPSRPEFLAPDPELSGEQRWLLFCLESFLDMIESIQSDGAVTDREAALETS